MNEPPRKKPTSFDVARAAGVHRSVVSRALNGSGRMSEETRQKVIQTARDLGYHVNFLARGLQGQSSGLVGLVASRLDTPYRAEQVRAAARELLRTGYTPLLIAAEGGDTLAGLMERLLNYNVAGMIVTSDTPPGEIIEECARLSVPVVLINRDVASTEADRVQINIETSGALAFEMLRARGGTRFAVLEPADRTYTVAGRAQSFVARCAAAGQPVEVIRPDGQDYVNGLDAAADCAPDIDAVFGTTDLLSLGFLDGLRRAGRDVPGTTQLIGFDDIPQSAWIGYDLSTIAQDPEGIAADAVDLLLNRIDAPERPYETRQIALTPVFRGTTRGPRSKPVMGCGPTTLGARDRR